MKTKYKWIEFREIPNPNKKTTMWECWNTSEEKLGEVYWLNHWRQYVYYSDGFSEYNNGCLTDIADFLTQLNKKQRANG